MKQDLDGKTIIFRGCSWDDHWEYDAPSVVYSPHKAYSPNGGGSPTVADLVQGICSYLADGELERIRSDWQSDLKEFQWRGWSPRGLARRRNAWHVELHVRFCRIRRGQFAGQLTSECRRALTWWGAKGRRSARLDKGLCWKGE